MFNGVLYLPSYVKANGSAFSSLLIITWCTWNDQGIFLALSFVWVSCDSNSETFHASFVIESLLNHWMPGSSRCVEFLPLKVGVFVGEFRHAYYTQLRKIHVFDMFNNMRLGLWHLMSVVSVHLFFSEACWNAWGALAACSTRGRWNIFTYRSYRGEKDPVAQIIVVGQF